MGNHSMLHYVQGNFGQVYLGDDEPYPIVGKGKIKIKLPNRNDKMLQEVRHVPNLRRNLISTGQLGSEGCVVMFTDNVQKVTKGSLVVAKGAKVGKLYLCTGNTYSTLVATKIDNSESYYKCCKNKFNCLAPQAWENE